ncbi:hypothetical protein PMAYCL1PPCAC_14063, partial [Pristionchus mayeri]
MFGSIAFERFIAMRYWRFLKIWFQINVMMCMVTSISNFISHFPHEINFIILIAIMIISFAIFAYAYIRNVMIYKSLNAFSEKYSVSHIFQVRENLRVL